jgi:hypothetical protein
MDFASSQLIPRITSKEIRSTVDITPVDIRNDEDFTVVSRKQKREKREGEGEG